MNVPPSGGAGCLVAASVLVACSVALALFHLVTFSSSPAYAVLLALLWLFLVAVNLRYAIRERGGARRFAVEQLGAFSSRHFVEVEREGERTIIRFGYELFRRRFTRLALDARHVVSVEMSSGQATALAGKDMDDWSIVLWYRDPTRPPRKHIEGARDDDVYIVGPARAKTATSELFDSFVAFLRGAGVE
jgi:hypothetical protein